jgi:ABC-2 type transport system ATP-binding protein
MSVTDAITARRSTAIETTALTRRFGPVVAIDKVTVSFPTGEIIGLVGPNGSGKSTLIRTLLGLIRPSSGTATVLGCAIDQPSAFAGRVGALIENPSFIESMSARANLDSLAKLRGLPSARVDEVLGIVGLVGREAARVSTFSLGMKQRLAIAAALLPDPELLVLDEPTNGLDPSGIVEMRSLLVQLATDGRTIVVSSHLMSELQAVCTYMVVIRFGALLYSGPLDQLITRQSTVRATPERPDDTEALTALLVAAGLDARRSGDDVDVRIDTADAALVSRLSGEAGMYLRSLVPNGATDLETAFLELTGSTDSDGAMARAAQLDSDARVAS